MTEEEEFEAVQHEAEAAAEEALHTSATADTPACNTRARSKIPAASYALSHGVQLCCIAPVWHYHAGSCACKALRALTAACAHNTLGGYECS